MRKRRKTEEGSAIILVMCVLVIFVALSLAIVLSASTLLADSQKVSAREQIRVSAVSLSKQLEEELTEKEENLSSLQQYIRQQIEKTMYNYGSLNPDLWHSKGSGSQNEIKKYNVEMKNLNTPSRNMEDEIGSFWVEMYWEENESGVIVTEGSPNADKEEAFQDIEVFVSVTSKKKDEKYQVNTQYQLKVQETGTNPSVLEWNWEKYFRE